MTRVAVLSALLLAPVSAAAQVDPRAPAGTSGTVTLSRSDYDRLLDLAAQRPPGVATAPTPAALARAEIRVRVDATAHSTIRVDGEVFRPGIAKVALIKDATLLDARLDNRPLPVSAEGSALYGFVNGPGTFVATLEANSAIVSSPGRSSFTLPVPNAGSATATIDVPGEQADVRVAGGIVLRRASANGRTIVDVAVHGGRSTEVWWSTHDAPATVATRDVRLLSDVKSIVTIGDADVRLVSLVTATVVQGNPAQIEVAIPDGYELVSVTGGTLDRSEAQPGGVALHLLDTRVRRHQFLVHLERAHAEGSFILNSGVPSIRAAQRESGEVAVSAPATIAISSPEMPGLRRIDVREVDSVVASIARDSLMAAYRYQRVSDEPPVLTVDVHRFATAPVLAAVAERAVATTLVTSEGRALTDITLSVHNTAQAFMKVALPAGASIVSVEVAGSPAKPVEGADGNRIPLLRPGFRPSGAYQVSFVYLHNGTPFLKKGDMQMALPKMDVPIDVLEWEVFIPEQFNADRFGGNVTAAALMPARASGNGYGSGIGTGSGGGVAAGSAIMRRLAGPGQIAGRVVDETGAPLPGVMVTVQGAGGRQTVITDANGDYAVSNLRAGSMTVSGELSGFKQMRRSIRFGGQGTVVDLTMKIGSVTETVTVAAESNAPEVSQAQKTANELPSANVQNLQRRASGVLPIRIDVPRTGTSHSFVKPLVVDEEAVVTFRYKRK